MSQILKFEYPISNFKFLNLKSQIYKILSFQFPNLNSKFLSFKFISEFLFSNISNYQLQNFNFKSVFKNFKHMINYIVPIKWDLVELICVTYKWAWVGPDCGPALFTTCVPTRWARLAFCCVVGKPFKKKRFGVSTYFCFILKGKNKIRKKNPKCDS